MGVVHSVIQSCSIELKILGQFLVEVRSTDNHLSLFRYEFQHSHTIQTTHKEKQSINNQINLCLYQAIL